MSKINITGGAYNINTDASKVDYDNTVSGLSATNIQDAINELLGIIHNIKLSDLSDTDITDPINGSSITYSLEDQKWSANNIMSATITNGIATFGGVVASQPLVSLKLNIPVTQTGSGTPAPDNVRDFISVSGVTISRTGINLWDEEWEVGGISSSTGENIPSTTTIRSINYIVVKSGKIYYFKSPNVMGIRWYDKDRNYISYTTALNEPKMVPNNVCYMRFVVINTTLYSEDISINYPSTDTSYHAYNGNTYQITFGQTVYSANIDVLNGKSSITHAYQVYNGSEDWQISSTGNNYYLEIGINFMITDTIIANEFENPHRAPTVDYIGIYNTSRFIQVRPSSAELDLQAWKTWLNSNNLQVVYELATPIEIDLTPTQITTLIGENVIFADVADVTECKYTRK